MKRKKSPLEQLAFDAWCRYADDPTPENLEAMRDVYEAHKAVHDGLAGPLPQYR